MCEGRTSSEYGRPILASWAIAMATTTLASDNYLIEYRRMDTVK